MDKTPMKKIILIFPPHWDTPMPSLGMAYLAAVLRSKGFVVRQIDLNQILRYKDRLTEDDLRYWIKKIVSEKPDAVGISLGHTTFMNAIKLMALLKQQIPNIFSIAGGPHVSYIGEKILGDFSELFDIGVFSEGEETILEILQKREKGMSLDKIPGTIIRKNDGQTIRNPPRQTSHPDTLPFPDFDDFSLNTYPLPILPMLTARGCINNCSFCGFKGSQVAGDYRERSIENVLKEMNRNIEHYNRNIFLFGDALINANPKRLNQLCDQIIKKRIEIYWLAEAFPHLTKNLATKMFRAGCRFLWISPETGSPRTAEKMNKKVNLNQAKDAIKNAKNAGIFTSVWFIIGFPTETEHDVKLTINYARGLKNHIDECTFVPFHLMVGSPIYRNPQKYNIKNIESNRYETFSSFHKIRKTTNKIKIMKYSERLWDEFNFDARFNFEIEKEIFFERLGFGKRILLELLVRDHFNKKKSKYRYEDLFRKALCDVLPS